MSSQLSCLSVEFPPYSTPSACEGLEDDSGWKINGEETEHMFDETSDGVLVQQARIGDQDAFKSSPA